MHKKFSSLLSLSICIVFVTNSIAQEKVYWDVVQLLKNEGRTNSKVMEFAWYLTDVSGPRLTGSPNMRNAQKWAKGNMEDMGLVNVAIEEAGEHGVSWDNEYTSLHMLEPDYQPLFGYSHAFTPGTDGKVTTEAVIATFSTMEELFEYRGKLRNKLVLISNIRKTPAGNSPDNRRYTTDELKEMERSFTAGGRNDNITLTREQFNRMREGRNRTGTPVDIAKRDKFFKEEGAAALIDNGRQGTDGTIFLSGRPGSRVNRQNPGARGYDAAVNSVPQISLAAEHYNRIFRLVEKGIPVTLEMEVRNSLRNDDSKYYNVVGEIPGTDLKDELIMLGAHFDSWHSGTGATDNAAGSAVVMEALRMLKSLGLQPRRTIRVALWSYEEGGLNGSREYIKKHFGNPKDGKTGEYDNFAGYFNMDNGSGQFRGVWLQGNEAVRPIFTEWMKPFKDYGMTTLSIRNTGGTDHLSYDRAGLPGWQFIQDGLDYFSITHHSNMDVYDSLVEEDMIINSVIMASFVYHAAMRDDKLPRKPFNPGR